LPEIAPRKIPTTFRTAPCGVDTDYTVAELRLTYDGTPPADLSVGDKIFGFQIEKVIEGGMSTIYVCDTPLGKLAMKTLRPEFSRLRHALRHFHEEAEAWIRLGHHPNIVSAQSFAHDNGRAGIWTEYQPGGTLSERIKTKLITRGEALSYAIQFCRGMIHARSVIPSFVHRDIKPENCLVDEFGNLRIADFGLVKILQDQETDVSIGADDEELSDAAPRRTAFSLTVRGTLPYMAPEQLRNFNAADVRSDIYSFGVMLFEMLTGKLPVIAEKPDDIASWQVAHDQRPEIDLTAILPDFPISIGQLVSSCLNNDPAHRPKDFRVILLALRTLDWSHDRITAELPEELWRGIERRVDPLTENDRNAPERRLSASLLMRSFSRSIGATSVTLAPPEDAPLDMLRPFSLLAIGRADDALAYADKIVEECAKDHEKVVQLAQGYALRAMVLHETGKHERAMVAADMALSLNAENSLALWKKGTMLNMQGKCDEAASLLEKCRRVDPRRRGLAFELAYAHNHIRNFDRAIEVLQAALIEEPDYYIFYRELGYAHLNVRQFAACLEDYDRAFSLCPPGLKHERAEIAANKANCLLMMGDLEGAKHWFSQAWQMAPDGSPVKASLERFFHSRSK
jgi:serine/threonine protein kinase